MVQRTVYAEVPPRVEYALTPLGRSLRELIAPMREWSSVHVKHIIAAQRQYDTLLVTKNNALLSVCQVYVYIPTFCESGKYVVIRSKVLKMISAVPGRGPMLMRSHVL